MQKFKVALLQLTPTGSVEESARKGEEYCRRAHQMGADLALFPEMWSIGYKFFEQHGEEGRATWIAQAIDIRSPYVTRFRDLARELNMAIALTYLEKWPGLPRNTVSIIDRHGEICLTYAKVHTCDFGYECDLTPGDAFFVCDLDTAAGPVKVGAMICYDREFPESARVLMLKGAEIIVTPNSCTLESNRLTQFRARAFENMVGVAMANYAEPMDNGHSVAYDAVAFAEVDDEYSGDPLIIEAGSAEDIYIACFDLDRIRTYREREAWGNSYRRPRAYAAILDERVYPPFVRPDARR